MWDVLIDRKGVNRIQTELLLRKAQSGDTGALDTLIAAYYPQILNYCRWHTADEQQAQDAAQETFLKAVRWLDSCGGFQGAFRPFLYKIAKNICIDLNRTMERSEISLESLPGEPAYQESGFAAAEEKANLRALTAQLEPEQLPAVAVLFWGILLVLLELFKPCQKLGFQRFGHIQDADGFDYVKICYIQLLG